MAKQTINIGTSANDGTGDPLRSAMDKTNDNFTELYRKDKKCHSDQYMMKVGGEMIVNLIIGE